MKRCTKCGILKEKSEFGKHSAAIDGLKHQCKACRNAYQRRYSKTEAGKKSTRKYHQSPHGRKKTRERSVIRYRESPAVRKKARERGARYRRTEAGKATKRKYYYSEKGQAAAKRAAQVARDSKKAKAQSAVRHAVEDGKILPTSELVCVNNDGTCEGNLEYHHYKGYGPTHHLDVLPLCRKHHCLAHDMNYHTLV